MFAAVWDGASLQQPSQERRREAEKEEQSWLVTGCTRVAHPLRPVAHDQCAMARHDVLPHRSVRVRTASQGKANPAGCARSEESASHRGVSSICCWRTSPSTSPGTEVPPPRRAAPAPFRSWRPAREGRCSSSFWRSGSAATRRGGSSTPSPVRVAPSGASRRWVPPSSTGLSASGPWNSSPIMRRAAGHRAIPNPGSPRSWAGPAGPSRSRWPARSWWEAASHWRHGGSSTATSKHLALERLSRPWRKAVKVLGGFGDLARGSLLALFGVYLIEAAVTSDPAQAKSVDQTLRTLVHHPFGALAIGAIALGLLSFGIYSFFDARLRRFS